ncbi:MAG: hypothetical protein H0U74_10730 [Bradymonadaceae bacterium]|nr:hypothetical protein [Lujinxingiaceae bacterium]
MTAVDDYIKQWSSASASSPVQSFSVDRENAVAMMRRFALADPSFYILELVQSAVANATVFIDIELQRFASEVDLRMRWTGRLFSRLALLNLFDYLFESEDNLDDADIILLARGINALLHYSPKRVVLFSADEEGGEGTQIEIDPELGTVTFVPVAKEFERFRGVCVRARGLSGMAVVGMSVDRPEFELLGQRVGLAKLEIDFNDARVRSQIDLRYAKEVVTTVSEDDVQARIWADPYNVSGLDLLTWGVKIERLANREMPFQRVGGVVNFNKFTKTADHYGVVRDAHLAHCLARLRPYVGLIGQDQASTPHYDICLPGGESLSPARLTELMRSAQRVLILGSEYAQRAAIMDLSARIAVELDALRLLVGPGELATVRALAGERIDVIAPNWDEPDDLAFFDAERFRPPARPWLIEEMKLEPIELSRFVRLLAARHLVDHEAADAITESMGAFGAVAISIYTPSQGGHAVSTMDHTTVSLVSCDRLIWRGSTTSVHAGHQLVVTLPAISPSVVLAQAVNLSDSQILAPLLAELAVSLAGEKLESATSLALRRVVRMDVEPGSVGSRLVLRALARNLVLSLGNDEQPDEQPAPAILVNFLSTAQAMLDVALFRTCAGKAVAARDLEALFAANKGLIYVAQDGLAGDMGGIDPSRVLALDAEQQRLLIEMIGADCIVELSATTPTNAGLGELDEAMIEHYVAVLQAPVSAEGAPDPAPRHHARRMLQSHLIALASGEQPIESSALAGMLLFDAPQSGQLSFATLMAAVDQGRPVVMLDGRGCDSVTLFDDNFILAVQNKQGPLQLAMNPFLAIALAPLVRVEPAFGFALAGANNWLTDEPHAYLVQMTLDAGGVRGTLGITTRPLRRVGIALLNRESGQVSQLVEHSKVSIIVGFLEVASTLDPARMREMASAVHRAEETLLGELLRELTDIEDEQARQHAAACLLDFAASHLRLFRDERGDTHFAIDNATAARILELPLFPLQSGLPVSALRMLRALCMGGDRRSESDWLHLSEEAPAHLKSWIELHLDVARIYQPPPAPTAPKLGQLNYAQDPDMVWRHDPLTQTLIVHLNAWIRHLWPSHNEQNYLSRSTPPTFVALPPNYGQPANSVARLPLADVDSRAAGLCIVGSPMRVGLNFEHPFIQSVKPSERLDEPTAWLMLAAFAAVSSQTLSFGAPEELIFQENLARSLTSPR